MVLLEKLELWRTRKIIWKWATYYILAMKDERNSSTTKFSCVQQIFILLLLIQPMSNQEVNSSYHYGHFSFHLQARVKFKSSGQFNISTADFHKRFRVSINKFYRVSDSHLTLKPFPFYRVRREQTTTTHRFLTSPQNAQRNPLVKYQTSSESYLKQRQHWRPLSTPFLTLNHLTSAERKHTFMSTPLRSVYTEEYTLFLSPIPQD